LAAPSYHCGEELNSKQTKRGGNKGEGEGEGGGNETMEDERIEVATVAVVVNAILVVGSSVSDIETALTGISTTKMKMIITSGPSK